MHQNYFYNLYNLRYQYSITVLGTNYFTYPYSQVWLHFVTTKRFYCSLKRSILIPSVHPANLLRFTFWKDIQTLHNIYKEWTKQICKIIFSYLILNNFWNFWNILIVSILITMWLGNLFLIVINVRITHKYFLIIHWIC